MNLFRIKICGVTRPADAAAATEAGADAIGLNFYPQSPRFLSDAIAGEVIAAIPPNVAKVGVFVNASAAEIRAKVDLLGLDFVQLHGDEPSDLTQELGDTPVIRAIRVGAYADATDIGKAAAILVDAHSTTAFGGTGKTIDWSLVPALREQYAGVPILLAGGLMPENVAEAIRIARPDGVDTASGVESSPGIKDARKMRAFIRIAEESLEKR